MKRLQPVIWMKGTFLSPQYLQMQDRFIESSLEFHLDALAYAGYGFRKLQINQEALSAGYVAISEASVKSALQQLFVKTGVRTRSQLVRVALEEYGTAWGLR